MQAFSHSQPSEVIVTSIHTHIHTHPNPRWRFMRPSTITRLTAHFMYVLMSYLTICKHRKRVWSCMTPNVLIRTRCHKATQNSLCHLHRCLTLTLPGPSAGVSGSLDSYCSLKPLCSGMGEVVLARTSLTLLPPSPRTVLSLSCFKVLQCINCRDWHCKR